MVDKMEDFAGFYKVPLTFETSGVYLLLLKGEIVYAGQSTNVFARIGTHWQSYKRKRRGLGPYLNKGWEITTIAFDEVRVKPCAKHNLDKEEIELIQKYLPKNNTLMKRPPMKVDLTTMPGFLGLIAKNRATRPRIKRRKLPQQIARVERKFQSDRDTRIKVTLPTLKFLQPEQDAA